eukprot:2669573-Amphidinium_carterae.1
MLGKGRKIELKEAESFLSQGSKAEATEESTADEEESQKDAYSTVPVNKFPAFMDGRCVFSYKRDPVTISDMDVDCATWGLTRRLRPKATRAKNSEVGSLH